ncbi:MAG: hypothetical protein ACYDHD_02255 [Vulcanimicrobiaceae bacterium]
MSTVKSVIQRLRFRSRALPRRAKEGDLMVVFERSGERLRIARTVSPKRCAQCSPR